MTVWAGRGRHRKTEGLKEEYTDTRDSAKRCPIYPQGQEKPQMLWLNLGCAPHPQPRLGLDCRESDASIVANTPTLLCETDSQFSPPPIKLTNHPPFPGSERQKRSSCTQTDRELSSEGERGVFQETLEQLPVNTLEETSVTTSLRKLPGHIVHKELTSTGSRGGHKLCQLNPTWNRLQPGQGSESTATEHRL